MILDIYRIKRANHILHNIPGRNIQLKFFLVIIFQYLQYKRSTRNHLYNVQFPNFKIKRKGTLPTLITKQ